MATKFTAVISALFLLMTGLPIKSHAQSFPGHGQVRTRHYRSPIDSMRLAAIETQLEQEYQRKPVNAKRIDSLAAAQWSLYRESVTFKNVYWPSRGYITTDSLKKMDDLSAVTKVSVYRKSAIPDIIWRCHRLEALEFVNSTIDKLPARLNDLRALTRIDIYNNRSERRLRLGRNASVEKLRILNERPGGLPRSYRKFKALTHLDLSENKLVHFPNGARRNRHLRELSLQRNEITLKKRIAVHRNLERLSLHENAIERVPRSIKNLRNLRRLNFNSNAITHVAPALGKLKHLEQLSFYRNALSSVPAAAYELHSLIEIDLFHNEIEQLGPGFANWQNLEVLYLSHNKLLLLPDNLDTLRKLTGLYARDNRLERLPDGIGNMKRLKVIRVNDNYLHALPPSMMELENLEEIDLSRNYIATLPPFLLELKHLRILAIGHNPFDAATRELLSRKVDDMREREIFVHTDGE